MTLAVGRFESERVQVPDPTMQPTPGGPIPSLYAVDAALLKSSIVTSARLAAESTATSTSSNEGAASPRQRAALVTLW